MRAYAIALLAAFVWSAAASPADATSPLAPTRARQVRIDNSKVRITWTDGSSDEGGFEVLRRRVVDPDFEVRGTVAANVVEFTDDDTPKDAVYIFRVRAFKNDEDSELSNECYVNRPPPALPVYFNARLIAHHVVRVGWSDMSNGERGFEIQRKDIGKPFQTVHVAASNEEIWEDYTLHPATNYTYRMRALGKPGVCWADSKYTKERFVTTNGGTRIIQVDVRGKGKGTVVSDPPGISCGFNDDHCSAEFPFVTNVKLIAKPKLGSQFRLWEDYGPCEDDKGACEVYMNDNHLVAARFRLNP
jgi:hypothetical protein